MPERILEWDGKIPAWGLLLIGISAVCYGWTWVNDLEKRVTVRETSSVTYRAKVDDLEKEVRGLGQLRGDISTLKELLIRIEKKLDETPRSIR